jgi:hypothetical protein
MATAPQGAGSTDVAISWCHAITTRDGTLAADSKMVNCFVEPTENGNALVKRAGTSYVTPQTGTAQGQFLVNTTPYFILNDTIYPTNGGTSYAIPSVTVAGQPYAVLNNVPPGTSLIKSPSGLWTFNGTTVVKVTDANYPATTVPGIAYLDGVYYVMNTQGQICGSSLEDPTTWPALDFIQADFTLGQGAAIDRHLNYIVAFYTQGIQLYYDAAAAPNGSGIALGPVGNASWRTGCAAGGSVVEMSDITFFLAQTSAHGKTVQTFNGLQMSGISTPFIEKILNLSTLATVWSFGVKVQGHQFYCLTLLDLNITLAFDLITAQWQVWSSLVNGVPQYFVGRHYLNDGLRDLLLDNSTGRVMQMLPSLYVDATGPLSVTSVTTDYDWGTMNWKRFAAMFQFGDTASTTVNVSFSDDDYQTFSAVRSIDMSSVRKMLRNCGSSRRRAWKMTHTDNTPLRLYEMKVPTAVLKR